MRRLSDGALEVHCAPTGHFLFCRASVGSEFEIRGQFDIGKDSPDDFQAGLVMGIEVVDHLILADQSYYSFSLSRAAPRDGV